MRSPSISSRPATRRRLGWLAAAFFAVLAMPAGAYVLVLKDGSKVFGKAKYEVKREFAVFTLESGNVAQIPLDSVTARIGAFLTQFTTTPQFVVQPEFHIVVRGEVRNPALYTVPLETTLGGAIAVAGGPTPEASLRRVTLVRDQHSYRLDLSNPAAPWTASPIRSGDQIIIGRKSNLFFGTILPLVTASAAVASLISVLRHY